jgi:hypothetical protein
MIDRKGGFGYEYLRMVHDNREGGAAETSGLRFYRIGTGAAAVGEQRRASKTYGTRTAFSPSCKGFQYLFS